MPTPAQLYAQGIQAYRTSSYDTAIHLFTQAIELAPKPSAKLYDARATAYDKLGKLQEGLLDAREVVKLMPASHKGYLRAARMLKAAGKYANAEKLLLQGLSAVPEAEEKGIQELEIELELVREVKAKAEHSPFSTLPLEIFVEIIALATAPPPTAFYSNAPQPLPASSSSKPKRLPLLFAAMRVSRTWYHLIKSTPSLWSTLRLDGVVNQKNAERKAAWWLGLASGGVEVKPDLDGKARRKALRAAGGGSDALVRSGSGSGSAKGGHGPAGGLRQLVLTAAQDLPAPSYTALLALLSSSGLAGSLRSVVLSFVDGSHTTHSAASEKERAGELLVFLHAHEGIRANLAELSICSGGRAYPDFDLAAIYVAFPRLESFRLCGSTTSNFVFSLGAPFLHHTPASATASQFSPLLGHPMPDMPPPVPTSPPTCARHLLLIGAVVVSDAPLSRASFPRLETLQLDVLAAPLVWDLLSCPALTTYHAVVYGEHAVASLPVPDVATAWSRVEDLKIGGAKRLARRLLDAAVELALPFAHLTALDLSFATLLPSHLALFSSDPSHAPNLASLNLSSSTTAPPALALALPERMDRLERLNVSHTLWTTDATLAALVKSAPRLERLEVRGNAFITGRPVMELVKARMPPPPSPSDGEGAAPSTKRYSLLTDLFLEGCTKLETPAVEWLRAHVRPGGVRFQFSDDLSERGRGKWVWGLG
ncbi:hypothetical protein JCM10207_003438 [Rhodosporidiobolus poonsookiae]